MARGRQGYVRGLPIVPEEYPRVPIGAWMAGRQGSLATVNQMFAAIGALVGKCAVGLDTSSGSCWRGGPSASRTSTASRSCSRTVGASPRSSRSPTQVPAMASPTGCASRRGRAVCWLRDFDPTAVFVGQNQFLITTSPWLSGAGFGHGCAQAKQVAASAPLCAKGGWGYRRTAS